MEGIIIKIPIITNTREPTISTLVSESLGSKPNHLSPKAAEINKNWNVNEVKTDKNRYHH